MLNVNAGYQVAFGAAAVITTAVLLRRGCRTQVNANVHPIDVPLETLSSSTELSVVSWNCLSQRYATTSSRFPHARPAYILHWEYRWPRIKSILSMNADIFCLQEVTEDYWVPLQTFMASQGYAAVRQGADHQVLLALFYRSSKLRLEWAEERSRALLVQLRLLSCGTRIYLINMHLEAHPYRPDVRAHQASHALARLARHIECQKEDKSPNVIVCGDFNSSMDDAVHHLLEQGSLSPDFLENGRVVVEVDMCQPFDLKDCYKSAGIQQHYTYKVHRRGSVLDHIFCSTNVAVVGVMQGMSKELKSVVDKKFLPNTLWPSDHLLIGAILSFDGPVGE